jgi:outer membrane immunogenic protein
MFVRTVVPVRFMVGLVVAASVLVGGRAYSADATTFTPAAPVVYDWSGLYGGLTAGATWNRFDTAFGTPSVAASFDAAGFSGGALAGVNFQNGPFVFGVEADANFKLGDDTKILAGVPLTADSDWFATLRGRAGYAAGRYLFYGTGGLALGDVSIKSPAATYDDTRVGWAVGAGVEAAINDKFTVRGEYLYTDLGKASGTVGGTPFSTEFDSHTIRAGVTYKFK